MAVLAFFLAMTVTMSTLALLSQTSLRSRLVAVPDSRRLHAGGIPQVGGIGLFLGIACGVLLIAGDMGLLHVGAYLSAGVLVFGVGLIDDHRGVDYRAKFAVQFAAAGVAVFGAQLMVPLPFFPGVLPLAPVLISGMIVFLVVVINALNLADGLDGLAGGLALISALTIGALAYDAGSALAMSICILLVGSTLGFLRFNSHPARLFMGDSGAYFLGLSLGFSVLYLSSGSDAVNVMGLLCVLGLPVYDVIAVMVRRIVAGRPVFAPDRRHVHHRMMAAGLSHEQAVIGCYGLHLAFVVVGYLTSALSFWDAAIGYLLLAVFAEVVQLPAVLRALKRRWEVTGCFLPARFGQLQDLAAYAALGSITVAVIVSVEDVGWDVTLVAGTIVVLVLAAPLGPLAAATAWIDRTALYLLGSYLIYLSATCEQPPWWLDAVELAGFGVLAAWLVARLVGSAASRLQLSALDLLMALLACGLALVESAAPGGLTVEIIKLLLWFYTVEFLIALGGQIMRLRGLAATGLVAIVWTGAVS